MKKNIAAGVIAACIACASFAGASLLQSGSALSAQAKAKLTLAGDEETEDEIKEEESGAEEPVKEEGKKSKKVKEEVSGSEEEIDTAGESRDAAELATITVTGTGTSSVIPDSASIELGVETVDSSPKTAQDKNSKDINNVISVLLREGVSQENIQTSLYDLSPTYDYSDGSGVLDGYRVTTMLTVSGLEVSVVGELLEAVMEAGVNEMYGISFSSDETETAYDQALEAALLRAADKAEQLAKSCGKELGDIVSVKEEASTSYSQDVRSYTQKEEDTDSSLNVMAGQYEVTAQVTITYYLLQN